MGPLQIPISRDAAIDQFNVALTDRSEVIRQPLYSSRKYPATGVSELQFFGYQLGAQTPDGVTATKRLTNLETAGSLPAPKYFVVDGISVELQPTVKLSTVNVVVDTTGSVKALENWNAFYEIARKGVLQFNVASKTVFEDAGLERFPPHFHVGGTAVMTNASGNIVSDSSGNLDYPVAVGQHYQTLPIMLPATQNFDIKLFWPDGLVSVVDQWDFKVTLWGILYRAVQ